MESKHPGGRPTKYEIKYNAQAYKHCLLGATDKDLADLFEVEETTINNWKIEFPKFFESIKKGKDKADAEVASKLYRRAMGYKFDEVTFEKVDGKINLELTTTGEIKTEDSYKKKVVTKEVASDVTAAIFWLKNRQKKYWRDKTEIDQTIKFGKDLQDATYE